MLNKPINISFFADHSYMTVKTDDEVEVTVLKEDKLTSVTVSEGSVYISQGVKQEGIPGYFSELSYRIELNDFGKIQEYKGLPCESKKKS